MIDFEIAIRSYGRAGRVTTLDVVPSARVWVCESQADEYESYYGKRVTVIPDAEDGNLARKMNAILDRAMHDNVVIMDDDVTAIGYWERGEHYWLDGAGILSLMQMGFSVASELGVSLWGIGQTQDRRVYRVYTPLSLLAPILGPFTGHLSPKLRYDESVLGKDDYDFWLQNIVEHRRTLRFNKYHYVHDHGTKSGGFVSMRTMEREQAGVKRMREKWGSKVFKQGGQAGAASSTGKNILNSRIRIPIPGC